MKGSPVREFFLVLLAGGLLAVPLFLFTRTPRARPAPPPPDLSASESIPAWFSLRFSHPPLHFSLRQADTLLARGGGLLQTEDDLDLTHRDGYLLLTLAVEWPEDVPSAYAELTLEPERLPPQRQGFWAKGIVTRSLEYTWTLPSP